MRPNNMTQNSEKKIRIISPCKILFSSDFLIHVFFCYIDVSYPVQANTILYLYTFALFMKPKFLY